MSLINKMLQDLDERRASALERDGISRHVRTLPPSRVLPWKNFVLPFAGALCGAVVVWLALMWRSESAVPVPPPAPTITPPVVQSPQPSRAIAKSRPIAQSEPLQPGKETPPPTRRGDKPGSSLQLDRSLVLSQGADRRSVAQVFPVEHGERSEAAPAASRIEKQPHTPVVAETAETEYRKGMNLIKRGSIPDAAIVLRAALQIDPRHLLARQALLSLLVDQQQWDEAMTVAAEGLVLDPKQAGWTMLVARLQVERGEMSSALETLDQHAKYAASDADYLSFHALLLQKAKRYQEAVSHYRAALALRPSEGRWWYGLGLALEANQQSVEAKEAYTQARATANLPADLATAVEQKLRP